MAKKKKSETEIFEEQLQKINEKKIKFSEEIYEKYHTIELKKLEERIQENYTGNRFEREEQGIRLTADQLAEITDWQKRLQAWTENNQGNSINFREAYPALLELFTDILNNKERR